MDNVIQKTSVALIVVVILLVFSGFIRLALEDLEYIVPILVAVVLIAAAIVPSLDQSFSKAIRVGTNGTAEANVDEIKDTWPRFFAHWIAATMGFFVRGLLPVLQSWTDPSAPITYPRWWVAFIIAAIISLLGAIVNSNLPAKPRELVKSIGLGFAFDAALVLAKVSPI